MLKKCLKAPRLRKEVLKLLYESAEKAVCLLDRSVVKSIRLQIGNELDVIREMYLQSLLKMQTKKALKKAADVLETR